MGQRILDIHNDVLTGLFKGGIHPAYKVFRDAMPEDAWVVRVEHFDIGIDRYPGAIRFTIESAVWPDLKPGEAIPSISPGMRLVNPMDCDESKYELPSVSNGGIVLVRDRPENQG